MARLPVNQAEPLGGARGAEHLAVREVVRDQRHLGERTSARNTAVNSCHQEAPIRTNAVHPPTKTAAMTEKRIT